MISVVMASYLGEYRNAAKNREQKIRRAVESVLKQTIPVELVVVADGCQKTVEIMTKHYEDKFSGYLIEHRTLWAGTPRNTGIDKAKGEIICYMDIDDYMDKNHCEFIVTHFGDNDWVWFDDWTHSSVMGWKQRKCNVNKRGLCGTSNIAHKKIATWPEKGGYEHDWKFVSDLIKNHSKYQYIGKGGYRVCHIPGRFDI